jgi:glycosyltransferase involved in cell wall biosynthesis
VAKERPTILQIIPRLEAGGAELAVVEIADAVVRAGGRALVLAQTGRLAERVIAAGGEIVPFPAATKNPIRVIANAAAIARFVAHKGVDVIHARSRAPAWSGFLAARRTGLPFVTTFHGDYSEGTALKRFYNSVMVRGDIVIANSRFTADLIHARYGIPRQRIELIYRGIDTKMFTPENVSAERVGQLRQAWGVRPHEHVVLHPARLARWKGQGVVIEAAARLKAAGLLESALVILAGNGHGRSGYVRQLKQRIADLKLEDRVRLVGHVEDIASAYLIAHVTVIASTHPETFGRSAAEAAAMGCPVIATNIGAATETIRAAPISPKEAATGWLVPPGDAGALAERIAEALALSPTQRSLMAERARRHVVNNFSLEAMKARTLAVYDRLLGSDLEHRFLAAVAQHG